MPKFKAFPKNESNTTYGECTAEDFNTLGYEIQNIIESANITTSLNENNQLSKAIANYVSIGALYNDVTTDYSHINLSIKAPFVAPTQYFDGMVVSFLPQGNNLENATINVNGLGEVQIRAKLDEEGILAGKIVLNEYIQLIYNSQINSFVIFSISNNDDHDTNNTVTVPLTCPVYVPNMFQDSNYLLSDNQYHSGDIYEAVWNLLTTQYNNESSVEITKTLSDGTSLTLKKTPLDYLICKIDENNTEEKINKFYDEIKFTCWVLDTTNNRFKLPQNTQRTLVESWKDENGNWYNLYNDGWLEQGGELSVAQGTLTTVNFLKPYKTGTTNNVLAIGISSAVSVPVTVAPLSETQFYLRQFYSSVAGVTWRASGYAELPDTFNNTKYLYFKVGNTTVGAEFIYANKVLTELDKKANISGDNITFSNLSDMAKDNILFSVLGGLQTEDNTKIGYVKFFNENATTLTLPSGGTYFVSIIAFSSTALTYRNVLTKQGFFPGGSSWTSDQNLLALVGFIIKIQ